MLVKSIIFIAFFSACLVCICKAGIFKKTHIPARLLMFIFFIKLCAGIGLNYVYMNYYTDTENADILKYFNDGKTLKSICLENPKAFTKIFFGIDRHNPELNQYYQRLSNWNEMDMNYQNMMNYQDANFLNSHRLMIRANTVMHFISGSFMLTHTLFFCFLGFIGLILMYSSILPFLKNKNTKFFFLLFLLFPSVLLWSSTILKEPLLYLGLGLFCQSVLSINSVLKKSLTLILSVILIAFTKIYLLPILVFSCFVMLLKQKVKYANIISFFTLIILLSLSHLLFPKFSPMQIIASKMAQQQKIGQGGYYFSKVAQPQFYIFVEEPEFEKYKLDTSALTHSTFTSGNKLFHYYVLPSEMNYQVYKNGNISPEISEIGTENGKYFLMLHFKRAGSYIPTPELKPTCKSFLFFFPFALKNVFLEPLFISPVSILSLLAIIENLLVLCLLILTMIFHNKNSQKPEVFTFFLWAAILLLLLIGYTNPIAGNIVRHKIFAISFLIICFILVFDDRKITTFIRRFPKPSSL